MKKNKGIIVTGGKLDGKNIAVGKGAKIEVNESGKNSTDNSSENIESKFVNNLKDLISKGKIKMAIENLLVYFKEEQNKEGLNATIMHSSSLTQLDMQENLGVITHEQGKIDRAKVTNAILQLIDNQIKK